MIINADNIDLFDTPLLLFRNNGLTYRQMFLKRCMDIGISLVGIVLASPVMIAIALAIKIYDKGPVFYKQKRLTLGGRDFDILKFRSMIVDSEKHGARLAKAHDDRITPVGKIIRRTHFDELPQLFNILLGDMSFVGPRPERKEITEEYAKEIPEFPFRLKAKAGLTGYAQVYGQYNTVPYDKLKLDLTYITKYTIWLDIKLIFLTVKILFQNGKTLLLQIFHCFLLVICSDLSFVFHINIFCSCFYCILERSRSISSTNTKISATTSYSSGGIVSPISNLDRVFASLLSLYNGTLPSFPFSIIRSASSPFPVARIFGARSPGS